MKLPTSLLSVFFFFLNISLSLGAPTQDLSTNTTNTMTLLPRARFRYFPIFYCRRGMKCLQILLFAGECRYVGPDFNDKIYGYEVAKKQCCAFYDDWECKNILFRASGVRVNAVPERFRDKISAVRCERSCSQV
ncbi:hypothetical protein BZA77DRAFT_18363 [Pyronema omphalodes]|nr:hypothetical protein BZA77DRAFT_18363 [Pyronema omphalodes]